MFDKLTTDFINRCAIEIKKPHNQELIDEQILNPVLEKFSKKVSVFFTIFFFMYILLLILVIFIFIILYSQSSKN